MPLMRVFAKSSLREAGTKRDERDRSDERDEKDEKDEKEYF